MYSVEKTKLDGVVILTPQCFADERGTLFESYSERALREAGIDFSAYQENHIVNMCAGVIRGFHFQNEPYAQAKLVRCTCGRVDDYAVDLRKGSPTYLKWIKVLLSQENRKQLFLPKGFAHGVISRSEYSEIQYVVDNFYAREYDRGIRFDDPTINVDWENEDPILSEKDRNAPLLAESDCNFIYLENHDEQNR
nr:dTDP-4-dehydrorhamnose 3,5-epimerase [uncultured Dysosmobacter sp.]